jgi:hypothetical protein
MRIRIEEQGNWSKLIKKPVFQNGFCTYVGMIYDILYPRKVYFSCQKRYHTICDGKVWIRIGIRIVWLPGSGSGSAFETNAYGTAINTGIFENIGLNQYCGFNLVKIVRVSEGQNMLKT